MFSNDLRSLRMAAFAAALFANTALAQQQLLDDFSGPDSNWTHDDQFAAQGLGSTTYVTGFGEYYMAAPHNVNVPQQVFSGSSYTASISDSLYANGIVDLTATTASVFGKSFVFVRGDAGFQNGYAFVLSIFSGEISIQSVTNGVPAVLASKAIGLSGEKTYRIIIEYRGADMTMKVWDVSKADPGEPQLVVADSAHNGSRLSVGVANLPGASTNFDTGFGPVSFTPCGKVTAYGAGCMGSNGLVPALSVSGCVSKGEYMTLRINDGLPSANAFLLVGTQQANLPAGAGCALLVGSPGPLLTVGPLPLDAFIGQAMLSPMLPANTPSATVTMQAWIADAAAPISASTSNGVEIVIP